jgi:hypothetical protein
MKKPFRGLFHLFTTRYSLYSQFCNQKSPHKYADFFEQNWCAEREFRSLQDQYHKGTSCFLIHFIHKKTKSYTFRIVLAALRAIYSKFSHPSRKQSSLLAPAHKIKHQQKLGFILCAGRDSVTDKFFARQKIFLDPASHPDFAKSGLRFASCAPAFESHYLNSQKKKPE